MTKKIASYIAQIQQDQIPLNNIFLNEELRQTILFSTKKDSLKKITRKKNDHELKHSVVYSKDGNAFALYNPEHSTKQKGIVVGTQGVIKIAQHLATGNFCLVKIYDSRSPSYSAQSAESLLNDSRNECLISKIYQEDYVLGYQEILNPHNNTYKTYLFMKEFPGIHFDQFDFSTLSKSQRLLVIYNLLTELNILGNKGIFHHDICGNNILIDQNLDIQFIDFGSADIRATHLVHGRDFEAIHELIAPMLDEDDEISDLLFATLDECRDNKDRCKDIEITPLLEEIETTIFSKYTGRKRTEGLTQSAVPAKRIKLSS